MDNQRMDQGHIHCLHWNLETPLRHKIIAANLGDLRGSEGLLPIYARKVPGALASGTLAAGLGPLVYSHDLGKAIGAGAGFGISFFLLTLLTDAAESRKVISSKTGDAIRSTLIESPLLTIGINLLVGEVGFVGLAIALLVQTAIYGLSHTQREQAIQLIRTSVPMAYGAFTMMAAILHNKNEGDTHPDVGFRLPVSVAAGIGGAVIGAIPKAVEIWAPTRMGGDARNIKFGQKILINSTVAGILCAALKSEIAAPVILSSTVVLGILARYLDTSNSRYSDAIHDSTLVGLIGAIVGALYSENNYAVLIPIGLGEFAIAFGTYLFSREYKESRVVELPTYAIPGRNDADFEVVINHLAHHADA